MTNSTADKTAKRLLEKSKEAFTLAVELYNRPTLRYHAEACSIFLCNAWELMLKAHLIKTEGTDSIYYSDNPDRTINLDECLGKIYTNAKSPIRINMRELITFRNVNTHFITDEWEIFYGPFLQAAVNNYAEQLEKLHNDSVSDLMPENHLVLAVRRGDIQPDVIRAKYEPATANKILKTKAELAEAAGQKGDPTVAAIYETQLRIVKKEQDADLNVYITKNSDTPVNIVKEIKDPTSYYPYPPKRVIEQVNRKLKKDNSVIHFNGAIREEFNMYDFQLFKKVYQMQDNADFSYDRSTSSEKNPSYVYSQKAVDFIVKRLTDDPNHLNVLKSHFDSKHKKTLTPGAKEFST